MTAPIGPLNDLLPEIYPIVAAHLPLYATPSTLLSLALTNRNISEIVLPLLYSRLILKNEKHALLGLQRLAETPPLGRVIRELHVMSELSVATRQQVPPADVVRRIADVISRGYLPFLHTLHIHLTDGWHFDADHSYAPNIGGLGELQKDFWAQLKEKCPRLRGLVLKGFTNNWKYSWLEDSGLPQVPDITNLTISFDGFELRPLSGFHKIFQYISMLAPSLHTLNLRPISQDCASTSPIFELDLPCLQSLTLASFTHSDTSKAMLFFGRHPSINFLDVASSFLRGSDDDSWLTSGLVPQTFLPNLRHLGVHFNDVGLFVPILNQLYSLSIHRSLNAQIPYLLRCILPNGLPNLKSLNIGQAPSSSKNSKLIAGGLWYESEDGTFQQTPGRYSRTIFDNYMHSIVRGAPNLEELRFHGSSFPLPEFFSIANDLNCFPHLKHLYFGYPYTSFEAFNDEDRDIFSSQARKLANMVPRLMTITNVESLYLPYLTATVSRTAKGPAVEVAGGYGMKIGYDDEAFPCAPDTMIFL